MSHNLPVLSRICNKGILLDEGEVLDSGNINDVIIKYIKAQKSNDTVINCS